MKNFKLIFSQRLKQLRLEKSLTQGQLGEKVSVIKQAVSKYEKTETFPAFETLIDLAEALEVSLDYLVGRTDER